MLRTPSIFGPLNSAFVPHSPQAPLDALADDAIAAEAAIAQAQAAKVVAGAGAAPATQAPLAEPVAPWLAVSEAGIRIVEGTVAAAICGYFMCGLLRTFAGA